jgi:hypothetical protein
VLPKSDSDVQHTLESVFSVRQVLTIKNSEKIWTLFRHLSDVYISCNTVHIVAIVFDIKLIRQDISYSIPDCVCWSVIGEDFVHSLEKWQKQKLKFGITDQVSMLQNFFTAAIYEYS